MEIVSGGTFVVGVVSDLQFTAYCGEIVVLNVKQDECEVLLVLKQQHLYLTCFPI
jgi:hypothetical protein